MKRRDERGLRLGLFVLFTAARLLAQASDGSLRVTGSATAGGTVQVDVGDNSSTITVRCNGVNTEHTVPPGKTMPLALPNVPAGTIVTILSGNRPRRAVALEIVSP